MLRWFKRYRKYHVVYMYVEKTGSQPIIDDHCIISDKKIGTALIDEFKVLIKSNYIGGDVVILNIIKL